MYRVLVPRGYYWHIIIVMFIVSQQCTQYAGHNNLTNYVYMHVHMYDVHVHVTAARLSV